MRFCLQWNISRSDCVANYHKFIWQNSNLRFHDKRYGRTWRTILGNTESYLTGMCRSLCIPELMFTHTCNCWSLVFTHWQVSMTVNFGVKLRTCRKNFLPKMWYLSQNRDDGGEGWIWVPILHPPLDLSPDSPPPAPKFKLLIKNLGFHI